MSGVESITWAFSRSSHNSFHDDTLGDGPTKNQACDSRHPVKAVLRFLGRHTDLEAHRLTMVLLTIVRLCVGDFLFQV